MGLLDNVKTMLEVEGNALDPKLNIVIAGCKSRLLAYLPMDVEEVPEELEWIVQELAIMRFNRIGNEGMSSYGQEGENISFSADEMAPFMSAIDVWNKSQESNKKGVVRFL